MEALDERSKREIERLVGRVNTLIYERDVLKAKVEQLEGEKKILETRLAVVPEKVRLVESLAAKVERLQAIAGKISRWGCRIESASNAIGISSAHTGPARTEISRVVKEMCEAAEAAKEGN